jgi:hypothetical protein
MLAFVEKYALADICIEAASTVSHLGEPSSNSVFLLRS